MECMNSCLSVTANPCMKMAYKLFILEKVDTKNCCKKLPYVYIIVCMHAWSFFSRCEISWYFQFARFRLKITSFSWHEKALAWGHTNHFSNVVAAWIFHFLLLISVFNSGLFFSRGSVTGFSTLFIFTLQSVICINVKTCHPVTLKIYIL